MVSRLQQLAAPPVFADEDQNRVAQLLNILLMKITLFATIWVIALPFLGLVHLHILIFTFLTFPLTLSLHAYMRRGYVRNASIIFTGGIWFLLTIAAFYQGGVRSPGFNVYIVIILIGGLLLGGKACVVFVGLSALAGIVMAFAETAQVIPTLLFPPFALWLIHTMAFSVAATVLSLALRYLNIALTRARYEIDARQHSEEALRESEMRLRQVLEQMPILMDAFDANGNIIFWNREAERVTGYSAKELIGNPEAMTLLYPDPIYREQMLNDWKQRENNYRNWEWKITHKDGSQRIIAWSNISKHCAVPGWATWGIGVDVTEQRQAEDALQHSIERLNIVHEIDQAILSDKSPETIVTIVLPRLRRLLKCRHTSVTLYNITPGNVVVLTTDETDTTQIKRDEQYPLNDVSNHTIQTNAPVIIHDTPYMRRSSSIKDQLKTERLHSYISMPMRIDDELIGILNIGDNTPNAFTNEHIAIADELTDQLAIAIRQVMLREQIQSYATELEQHVAERTAEISDLYNNAPCGYHSLDSNGVFVHINATGLHWLGYTQEDLLGRRRFADLLPQHSAITFQKAFAVLKEQGEINNLEMDIQRQDRTILTVLLNATAILDQDGSLINSRMTLVDITDYKKAERELRASEARYRAIVEDQTELICRYLPDGTLSFVNEAYCRYFGKERAELIGYRFTQLIPPDEHQIIDHHLANLCPENPTVTYEHQVMLSNGDRHWQQWTDHALFDEHGTLFEVQAVGRDITPYKQAEIKIRTLNTELAHQTHHLENVNRELETFTYSVSHDLKAPLRAIDGYSQLLLEDYAQQLDEDGNLFLKNIRQSTQNMGILIDDLLTYSRLERRPIMSNTVDLQALINSLLAEQTYTIREQAAIITVNLTCTHIAADSESLTQALRNLLDNALKFTRNTSKPSIEIGGAETATVWTLWVRDNGSGFDMKYHNRIFDIFQRLHHAEDYPGTGIGLAIVRKAIQRMGGRTWAESTLGSGAIFYLEIPK